jgi:hypothetical protein
MENNIVKESGYFWWRDEPIPDDEIVPASAVAGDLIITHDGKISLELHGYLPSAEHPLSRIFAGSRDAYPDIEGRLKTSSEHVLLMEVYASGGKASFGGISYENYRAEGCLVGPQPLPRAKGELKFDGLSIPLTVFEDWLALRSIETTRTKSKLVAIHKTKKNIKYSLSDNSTMLIEYDLFAPMFGSQKNYSIDVREEATLKYLSRIKQTSADLRKYFISISDFLMVLTGSDYSVDWPFLTLGRSSKTRRSYRFYFRRSRNTAARPSRHDSWLTFSTIQDSFGYLFQDWKLKREEFGPGLSLYLGTRRGVDLYVEHRFVNLIWGLESLHRSLTRGAPPTPLEVKVQRIIAQVGLAKDRKWLEGKLEHSAEPSLAERLVECLKLLPLTFSTKSLNLFCKECANRRNDISHFGGQRTPGSYGEFVERIHYLNNALNHIYPAIILKLCGVGDAVLMDTLTSSRISDRIKRSFGEAGLEILAQ